MHIHPPKPLHGWREFVGEVGVIVIGVLIALSAEQVVDQLHWRHETHLASEALARELAVRGAPPPRSGCVPSIAWTGD